MAGDWIPFTKALPRKPEVARLMSITGMSRAEVVLNAMLFWSWADEQTDDGKLGLSVTLLSHLLCDIPVTFIRALCEVGWLVESQDDVKTVSIPHFGYWMGKSAKKRLKAQHRQQQHRTSKTGDEKPVEPVTLLSRSMCDKSVTTVQNSTDNKEAIDKPTQEDKPKKKKAVSGYDAKLAEIPPVLDTPKFKAAWLEWCEHRIQKKKPITELAAKKQIKQLTEWGEVRALRAIECSIRRDWEGIYEDNRALQGSNQLQDDEVKRRQEAETQALKEEMRRRKEVNDRERLETKQHEGIPDESF